MNDILTKATVVANADLAAATSTHEAVAARNRVLGETLTALDKYISAAELRVARLPSSEQAAAQAALTVAADPANAVNTILNAVEAARAEREKAVRDLGAMIAARKALEGARLAMHGELSAAHRELVKAQEATRICAKGARTDEVILTTDDPTSLSGVEKTRREEIMVRASRYVEAAA